MHHKVPSHQKGWHPKKGHRLYLHLVLLQSVTGKGRCASSFALMIDADMCAASLLCKEFASHIWRQQASLVHGRAYHELLEIFLRGQ